MRSHLLVLSAISLAVTGCGKSVERSATPASLGQQNGTPIQGAPPVETRPGLCQDPIPNDVQSAKPIAHFSDIAMPIGRYKLVSFDAVGTATQAQASAISVVSGTEATDGKLQYTEVCRDLSTMPQGNYQWTAIAPNGVDAKSGAVAERIELAQTVFGPAVTDQNGPRQPTTTLNRAASRGRATDVTYYQIDSTTIGVLRTTDSSMNGAAVQSKIFARYTYDAGSAPTPTPTKPTHHHPKPTPGKGGQGNGGQGNGGQGNSGKGNGGQGNGGQGNGGQGNGGQGNTTTPTTGNDNCGCTVPTTNPPTTTTSTKPTIPTLPPVTAPTVTSKAKLHVKEKTVENNVEGETVTKHKIDAKVKTNAETGTTKEKTSEKLKETSPEGTSKVKSDEKIKTNAQTGDEKVKTDYKKKTNTATTSTKVKVKFKIKTKGQAQPQPTDDDNSDDDTDTE